MDKTESTVRIMLTAIEAPLYDVGVLVSMEMLPGLDGMSAAAVLDGLSLLKYHRNARGSHIPFVHQVSIASPRSDLSEAYSSRGSRRIASTRVRLLRPALATFRPGSSTPGERFQKFPRNLHHAERVRKTVRC